MLRLLRPAAASCSLPFWRRLCEPKSSAGMNLPPCARSSLSPQADSLPRIAILLVLIPSSAGTRCHSVPSEEIRMYLLQELGWCEFFEKQWKQKQGCDLIRARISEENRGLYKIISE